MLQVYMTCSSFSYLQAEHNYVFLQQVLFCFKSFLFWLCFGGTGSDEKWRTIWGVKAKWFYMILNMVAD